MKWIKNNLSIIIIIMASISVIIVNFLHQKWNEDGSVIEWDVKSYYSYLPAAFIYNDLSLDFLDNNKEIYDQMWPVKTENGNYLIVTSAGLSMLYSPFFFASHVVAKSTDFKANGYSIPYRFALTFSSLFYFLLGMIFLRKILKKYFREEITALTLLAIAGGTNLFYYITFKAPMPHCYNFALIALFVWLTIKWHKNPRIKNTIGIGLLFGLITLIRPTNILVLIFFVLWDVKTWPEFKTRISFFFRRFDLVLIMIFFFLVAWFPQFAYWKHITGQWIYYSYGAKDAGFFFGNPQIYNILISYKKGWFVYTPIMALAFAGIFFMIKRLRIAFWATLVYILAMIYVLSSWWCWWYGGGFSLRAFIDTYAIMAIPLASLLSISLNRKTTAIISISIVLILTWFNTFQIRQYRHNTIHFWWMNKEAYWETFLKLHPTKRYYKVLTVPDYEKARKGIYEAIPFFQRKREKRQDAFNENYENYIRNQPAVMDSLKTISKDKTELNNLIRDYMKKNKNQYILQHKGNKIKNMKEFIRNKPQLMEKLKKNTNTKNINLDSMVTMHSLYMFKKGVRK